MSKDNNQGVKGEYQSAESKALERFASMMIERLENIRQDWKKPWFTEGALSWPKNLSGREYNGMNALVLMMHCEKQGYKLPVFCTFDRVTGLNFTKDRQGAKQQAKDGHGDPLPRVAVNKGEKSFPVFITTWSVVHKETKERIKYDDYKQLPEEERAKYNTYPKLQVYNVFNVAQTNLEEARPDLYKKLVEANGQKRPQQQGEQFSFPPIDHMIAGNGWICPIKPTYGDNAYYSISRKEIVIPEKSQFKDGESFYSNLAHEMAHSTGAEDQLNRLKPSSFGSKDYAREELVAELSAALVAQRYGMSKNIKEDSAAYIKSWLDSLKESPDFIKTTLTDVKRAAGMITQRIDAIQMKINNGESLDNLQAAKEEKTFGSYQIPEWSLPYIINGDASGITDKEKDIVDKFLEEKFPDGYIPELEEGTKKELDLYPAFGERNGNALTDRGESPYLAVDTVSVKFSSPGYFEARHEETEDTATEVVVDNRKPEEVAAKLPPKNTSDDVKSKLDNFMQQYYLAARRDNDFRMQGFTEHKGKPALRISSDSALGSSYYIVTHEQDARQKDHFYMHLMDDGKEIFKSREMPQDRDDACSFMRGAAKEQADYEYEKRESREETEDKEVSPSRFHR